MREWQQANADKIRAWRARNREPRAKRSREIHLRRRFGLSVQQYQQMLDRHGGGCGICGTSPPANSSLHVDHDHATGEIRGLLRVRCNNGLGQFMERPEMLHAAANWIDSGGFVPSGARELTELARQRARSLVS